MICIIPARAPPEQMQAMLEALGIYVQLVVYIQRRVIAGGGELHADCEQILLQDGSLQINVWGADWYPTKQSLGYESIINIRVSANNRSMEIQDSEIHQQIESIVREFLGEVQWQ